MHNKETDKIITINLFKEITTNGKWIIYEFDQKYLNFTLNNLSNGFFITLSIELKNFKSKYSPKLLRLLKSEVSLGIKNINIKIDYKFLKKFIGRKWLRC